MAAAKTKTQKVRCTMGPWDLLTKKYSSQSVQPFGLEPSHKLLRKKKGGQNSSAVKKIGKKVKRMSSLASLASLTHPIMLYLCLTSIF